MHQAINYLLIGHITLDITSQGYQLGGTATYSGLTAAALGYQVGLVTNFGGEIELDSLSDIHLQVKSVAQSTIFENISTPDGRQQILHNQAEPIVKEQIPPAWMNAQIVHIGPVADEVDAELIDLFKGNWLCITPQGWMRRPNPDGTVQHAPWKGYQHVLENSTASVMSIEDVNFNEDLIQTYSQYGNIIAVTEGYQGARIYWRGDVRRFKAPPNDEADPTGAGDIFAACFFHRLRQTRDPWSAARFAVELSSVSVTRTGLDSIPTPSEIQSALVEVL